MAQIFISHSKKDDNLINFFSNAFAITKVKAVFEEFERIRTNVTAPKIMQDIEQSNALFLILSQNVQDTPHTRDWVVWETGVAKNKDIWVFESYAQLGSISVVTPYIRHYVLFDTIDIWLNYIRTIIESYDDSNTFQTTLLTGLGGASIGAALSEEDKVGGALLGMLGGAVAGRIMSDNSKQRPLGLKGTCIGCYASYNIHFPEGINEFRCPVCNKAMRFIIPGERLTPEPN